jgi:hypothetical protein
MGLVLSSRETKKSIHAYTPPEVGQMLDAAGLATVAACGSLTRVPLTRDSRGMTL